MSENWTTEELDASVRAYLEMRDLEHEGKPFVKTEYYRQLSSQFGRTPKAYEYRMQNISHVLSLMGRRWVKGLPPAKNVGTNVTEVLEKLIQKREGVKSTNVATFQSKVAKHRKDQGINPPKGNKNPSKTTTETTNYSRDPKIVAWILENSSGICESCQSNAPFQKYDDSDYLEVHHLRRLADNGSDTITNAVAVCPNCHMELHYGKRSAEILQNLYSRIGRLVKE